VRADGRLERMPDLPTLYHNTEKKEGRSFASKFGKRSELKRVCLKGF